MKTANDITKTKTSHFAALTSGSTGSINPRVFEDVNDVHSRYDRSNGCQFRRQRCNPILGKAGAKIKTGWFVRRRDAGIVKI